MKHWLARRAPALQHFLHLIDGRALAAVSSDVRALARVVKEEARDAASFERVLRAVDDRSREPELAWIGPAPYEETGIGRFSLEAVKAAPRPTDFFAAATRPGLFLAHDAALAASSPHRLFDIDAAVYAATQRRYRAIVATIGGSHHNLAALRAADELEAVAADAPLWWYVHDVALLNLVWLRCGENPRVFAARMRAAYGADAVPASMLSPRNFAQLQEKGLLGLRALLRGRRIDRIIVNSRFAAGLVERELEGLAPRERILTLFHPVFPLARKHAPPKGTLRIGSFGAPGAAKQTDLVVEACAALRRRGHDATLILAGYGMDRFLGERRAPLPGWATAFDSPSRAQLEELMAGVTAAVQLRRDALGESSGVAADLAAIGVPTIVSDVGALAELSTAVARVPRDVTAEDLAQTILDVSRISPMPAPLDLSPEAFWRALGRELGLHAQPDLRGLVARSAHAAR